MVKGNPLEFTKVKILRYMNRTSYRGKLVSFRGLVNAIGPRYPEYGKIAFECKSCMRLYEMEQKVTLGNRITNRPLKCDECGGRAFNAVDDASTFVDVQFIEIADINELRNGEIFTTILLLKENLVDIVNLGELVEIKGVVETNKNVGKYFNFVNVVSIEKLPKIQSNIELDRNDEKCIQNLANDPKIFELFVKSFAPSIRGHFDIKEAIILQLFSIGSESEFQSENYVGSPNILLVDENGLVSEILKFTSRVSPAGIFLNGRKPLPIIPKTEIKFRRHLVESGVLILSDESILCIDKINSIRYAKDDIKLAMEAQLISVKIGGCTILTLPAKTTVLAGISSGKINKNSPVNNQLSMKPDLFFEFDLVFLANDEYHHIACFNQLQVNSGDNDQSEDILLSESLIRNYISYTNQLNPQIFDKNVHNYLLCFFLDLRMNFGTHLINQKKFNSVIELAKASARIHLRDEITMEDAERAINVYKNSLRSKGFNLDSDQPNIKMVISKNEINQNKKILSMIFKDIIRNKEELSFDRLVEVMSENSNLEPGLIRILVTDEYGFIE